ncbi:hypothetical protein VTK56DRAFT_6128 [Thermocarpiscus australiensis]
MVVNPRGVPHPAVQSSRIRKPAAADRETAPLLAVLRVGLGPRADAEFAGARVHQGTAGGGAVGVAGALAPDELPALAVSDVAGSRRVGLESAGFDGAAGTTLSAALSAALSAVLAAALASSLATAALVRRAAASTAGLKAASLLASLVLRADAGADADRLTALGQRRTTSRGTVGGPEALPSDELTAGAVADVLLAGGVRNDLAE